MKTETKNSRILIDPGAFKRRGQPIIVFGVDLSLKKGIAWGTAKNERIIASGVEETISLTFQHVPEGCSLIITEKMFIHKNKRVALELERAVGILQYLCEENQIPFQQVLGATWQSPIKKAFGLNGKPAGMKDPDWELFRYRKFRIYLYGFLGRGLQIDSMNNDQIAAGCLALHGSRELKKKRLYREVR